MQTLQCRGLGLAGWDTRAALSTGHFLHALLSLLLSSPTQVSALA